MAARDPNGQRGGADSERLGASAPEPRQDEAEGLVEVEGGFGAWLRKKWALLLASVLLGLGLAYLLHRGALPMFPAREAFAKTTVLPLVGYTVLWVGLQFLRGLRWKLLLAPLGRVSLGRVMRILLIGYAALVILPFRMGEVVRPGLMRLRGGMSLMATTGTLGAERIIDGLLLSGLLIASLGLSTPLSPLPDRIGALPIPARIIPQAAITTGVAFLLLFVGMLVFYRFREFFQRLVQRVLGGAAPHFAERFAAALSRLGEGLQFLRAPRTALPFVATTLLFWFGNALATWLLMWGTGLTELGFVEVMAICGVLSIGVIVPSAPGFFGSFQISAYAGMIMFVPMQQLVEEGAAFVFILYVIQIGTTLLLGLGAALLELRTRPARQVSDGA